MNDEHHSRETDPPSFRDLNHRLDRFETHIDRASQKVEDLTDRVTSLEKEVAGGPSFPLWAKGMVATLLLQTAGAVWWAAQIDARVESMPQLQERLTSAFQAMRNNDSVIATMQSEHVRIRQELDGIQRRTIEGTDDRWRKRDDDAKMADLQRYLDAQFKGLDERLNAQEVRSQEMDRRWQYLSGSGLLKGFKR